MNSTSGLPATCYMLVEGEGFEPSKAEPSDLQSDPFGHSGTPPNETAYYGDFLHFCQTVGRYVKVAVLQFTTGTALDRRRRPILDAPRAPFRYYRVRTSHNKIRRFFRILP